MSVEGVSLGGDVGTTNPFGQTALHVSAQFPAIVERLLAAGADPMRRDMEGWTPLGRAYTAGNTKSIALIEAKLRKVSRQDFEGAYDDWKFKVFRAGC